MTVSIPLPMPASIQLPRQPFPSLSSQLSRVHSRPTTTWVLRYKARTHKAQQHMVEAKEVTSTTIPTRVSTIRKNKTNISRSFSSKTSSAHNLPISSVNHSTVATTRLLGSRISSPLRTLGALNVRVAHLDVNHHPSRDLAPVARLFNRTMGII